MSAQQPSQGILIIGRDADELARLVRRQLPDADLGLAGNAEEAVADYGGQRILLGSPLAIARALPRLPTVDWVQSTWAGVTPLIELGRRDYVLTGIKGVFGPQMAEYVAGYLLAHELRIIRRHEAQRAHRWWQGTSGSVLGKRVGIMGTGSIGADIAQRCAGLGMTVTGLSRSGVAVAGFERVFPVADIEAFLSGLDYLVSVLPDTPQTGGLLDGRTLSLLPSHACFINVGRANVVDDDALVAALRDGRLGGAVLDVFDEEPIPADSHLWDTPNLVVTAHMAAVSHPELIVPIFLENYVRFAAGRELTNVIDFDRGY